jgi:hypothetical protein
MKKTKRFQLIVSIAVLIASVAILYCAPCFGQSVLPSALSTQGESYPFWGKSTPLTHTMTRQMMVRGPQPIPLSATPTSPAMPVATPNPNTLPVPSPTPQPNLPTTLRFVELTSAEGSAFPIENIRVSWTDTPPPILPIPRPSSGQSISSAPNLSGKSLPAKTELAVGKLNQYTVDVDLRDVRPGLYTGKLLFDTPTAITGSEVIEVPISITIRDNGILPFIILFCGIVLSIILNWNVTRKSSDSVLLSVGQIESSMNADSALSADSPARIFFNTIEGKLSSVVNLINENKVDEAKNALADAQSIHNRWIANRSDWFEILSEIQSRIQEVLPLRNSHESPSVKPVFLGDLLVELAKIHAEIPQASNPAPAKAALEVASQALRNYNRLLLLIGQTPAPSQAGFMKELDETTFKDHVEKFKTLGENATNAIQSVTDSASLIGNLPIDERAQPVHGSSKPKSLTIVPALSSHALNKLQVRNAVAMALGYWVAVILQSMAGFYTLYILKPTFGSVPFLDYSLLFGYGFGVSTLSRPAVAGAFSALGIDGLLVNPKPDQTNLPSGNSP